MNMPGFYAEASLARAQGTYRSRAMLGTSDRVEMAAPIAQSCTKKYSAYISHWFPKTVCEPLYDGLTVGIFRKTMRASPGVPGGTLGSRAVSLNPSLPQRAGLGGLHYCRVVYLPFIAEVTTSQSCDDVDKSRLEVYDHPELTLFWTGGIEDIPKPYNPNWFDFTGMSCSCCPGLTECLDGRCVPFGVSCDIHPA